MFYASAFGILRERGAKFDWRLIAVISRLDFHEELVKYGALNAGDRYGTGIEIKPFALHALVRNRVGESDAPSERPRGDGPSADPLPIGVVGASRVQIPCHGGHGAGPAAKFRRGKNPREGVAGAGNPRQGPVSHVPAQCA